MKRVKNIHPWEIKLPVGYILVTVDDYCEVDNCYMSDLDDAYKYYQETSKSKARGKLICVDLEQGTASVLAEFDKDVPEVFGAD